MEKHWNIFSPPPKDFLLSPPGIGTSLRQGEKRDIFPHSPAHLSSPARICGASTFAEMNKVERHISRLIILTIPSYVMLNQNSLKGHVSYFNILFLLNLCEQ